MKDLKLPFNKNEVEGILSQYGSPIYIYDEEGIREKARKLKGSFSKLHNYKNFFAVKATPTPAILKILHEEGMGFDCSSKTELTIMQKMGITGDNIFFTSNNTSLEDFQLAVQLGATINLDDITQISVFKTALKGGPLNRVAVRYNPGNLKSGNQIIGEPVEAKYGMTQDQIVQSFNELKQLNINEFGIHTMVASNELIEDYFTDTAKILLDIVDKTEKEAGVKISFINLGGGFGVNYKPEQAELATNKISESIEALLKERDRSDLTIFTENGRYITGPHGYLVTKVRYVMEKYKKYIGVDASMHNLMRPGMYGAYHHITVLGKEGLEPTNAYDIVGSLCENNDKFAIDRKLPEIEEDDILVIHDAGAHGHAMGFNYNGLTRSAEVLLNADRSTKLIRRAETTDQILQNVIWE